MQRKILNSILVSKAIGKSSFGLTKDRGILNNAKVHQKNIKGFLVVLDIKDFFPNTGLKSVRRIFKEYGFNSDCANALAKICTVDGVLPQGAVTSPYLSSMICNDLDNNIYNYCKKNGVVYSRYFDDISLSGESVSEKNITRVKSFITEEGFTVNGSKTKIFKPTEEKVINNVVIKKASFDVTSDYRLKIRKSFEEYLNNKTQTNHNIFTGHMAFYLHINRSKACSFYKELTGIPFKDRSTLL